MLQVLGIQEVNDKNKLELYIMISISEMIQKH